LGFAFLDILCVTKARLCDAILGRGGAIGNDGGDWMEMEEVSTGKENGNDAVVGRGGAIGNDEHPKFAWRAT